MIVDCGMWDEGREVPLLYLEDCGRSRREGEALPLRALWKVPCYCDEREG